MCAACGLAQDGDGAAGDALAAHDGADEGGFATPGGAEQSGNAAFIEGEGESVKDVVFSAGDMEVSDFHRGGGSCTHTTTIIQQVLNLQGL